ncbi:hypothetical protein [Rhizobacter sp. SG703]|uniref:hypothetical protein n=1 Tax=Rhizobacter sp. SG703 TaxID=2587140 RepID=UPI0014451F0D|nr:hypothetical protein [Rhizobacter sp. SG703]NKI96636.1 hypothetical protein [Rhizobacter sp. SG703]
MGNLRTRLANLESVSERGRSSRDNELQNAVSALFDALERHYLHGGYVRATDGTIARQTAWVQVTAAAKRLEAGALTEQDRAALEAMPDAAIGIFGHTAQAFLVAAGFG